MAFGSLIIWYLEPLGYIYICIYTDVDVAGGVDMDSYLGCSRGVSKGPCEADIDIDIDVEGGVDIDSHFGCLKAVSKSVQVLSNGIGADFDGSEVTGQSPK